MDSAQMLWYIKQDEETYSQQETLFAGTYHPGASLSFSVQLWNNRYGTVDVKDLENFHICVHFDKYEDSSLLKYCSIENSSLDIDTINYVGDTMVINFTDGAIISGDKNNGTTVENPENYWDFDFVLSIPENVILKENDLKGLYFEIIED